MNRTDSAQWRARQPHIAAWRASGLYAGRNVAREIELALARHAQTRVVFSVEQRVQETTVSELWAQSARVAAALAQRGLRAGDAIAFQLPNCRETTLVFLAAMRLGLVLVPIVHIYGAAELGYILRATRARALVMPVRWRNIDFAARLRSLGELPELESIFAVGDGELAPGAVVWTDLEAYRGAERELSNAGGDDICVINFTSGTTAAPKGVMHSHHSLIAGALRWPPSEAHLSGGPLLRFGPAGHIGGVMTMPRMFLLGDEMINVDQFETGVVAELCDRYQVRRAAGVPTQMRALLEHCNGRLPGSISSVALGGTSIPTILVKDLERAGARAVRSFASTEHPCVSAAEPGDPLEKRIATDGRVMRDNRVRIVDEADRTLPPGEPGELLSIGPQLFQGYLDAALDEAAFASDGYYRSGDIAVMDGEGYITIVDRKKDIVVRGGENISSREVEELLLEHPAVVEAAVIGWPDARLGERVGAFVQLRPGTALQLEEVRQLFERRNVARQKTPEHLVVVDQFPRTAVGKIVKAELRKRAREA